MPTHSPEATVGRTPGHRADPPRARAPEDGAAHGGDFAFLYDLFDEDVVWHGGGTSQMFAAGTHGRDAVFAQFGKIEGAGTFERELKHVLADEYHAVALVHNDVHKGDTHMQWYEMMVFHLNPEGRIIEFWGLHEDPDAVDRLWAEPASA